MNTDTKITRAQYNQLIDEKILTITNTKVGIFSFMKVIRQLIVQVCDVFKITSELSYAYKTIIDVNEQFTNILQAQQNIINDLMERVDKLERKK